MRPTLTDKARLIQRSSRLRSKGDSGLPRPFSGTNFDNNKNGFNNGPLVIQYRYTNMFVKLPPVWTSIPYPEGKENTIAKKEKRMIRRIKQQTKEEQTYMEMCHLSQYKEFIKKREVGIPDDFDWKVYSNIYEDLKEYNDEDLLKDHYLIKCHFSNLPYVSMRTEFVNINLTTVMINSVSIVIIFMS